MSVRKRTYKSGRTAWVVDYYDAGGKRRLKAFETKQQATRAEAKFKERKFNEEILGVKELPKIKFSRLRQEFLEFSKLRKKRNTYISHTNSLKFLKKFDDKYLSDITLKDISEYEQERLKTISVKSLNRELACLNYMMNFAIEQGYAEKNHLKKKKERESGGRILYLTKEEADRFLSFCSGYFRVFVQISLNAGLRKGEVLALTWREIDFNRDLIHVQYSQDVKGNLDTTKGNACRSLPINSVLRESLLWWRAEQQKPKAKLHPKDPEKLFTVLECRSPFYTAKKHAKINPDFRIHDLRHTFASHLVMQGVDLATVSKLLGHTNISMTMRYAHLSPDHKKNAIEKMGRFLL